MVLFKKLTITLVVTALSVANIQSAKSYASTPQETIKENLVKYQELNGELLELNDKIAILDTEINTLNLQLENNKNEISSIEIEINSTELKLEQTQTEIENVQSLLDNRVRSMYKSNLSSNLIVSIVTSTSLSDLISKVQAISKLISADKDIINAVTEKKNELSINMDTLNSKNQDLTRLQLTIENDLKTVEEKKSIQKEFSDNLNSEIQGVFSIIEENEKTLIDKSLSIANSTTASVSELQGAIDTLNSLIPQLNSKNVISLAKSGISNAKQRIAELNTPSIPTSGGNTGTAIKTFTMESTAYYGHTITASGLKPVRDPNGISTVAVDPKVIPLGSKVYVSGYGVAIAADTGGAIKGNKIDVFLNTYEECRQWGRKSVTVELLAYPGEW